MDKNKVNEATGASSSGKYKIPLNLAPQLWEKEVLEPFTLPVSKYVSAMNAYDSYDGEMERDSSTISANEKRAIKLSKDSKNMFSQNDDDGNPFI